MRALTRRRRPVLNILGSWGWTTAKLHSGSRQPPAAMGYLRRSEPDLQAPPVVNDDTAVEAATTEPAPPSAGNEGNVASAIGQYIKVPEDLKRAVDDRTVATLTLGRRTSGMRMWRSG